MAKTTKSYTCPWFLVQNWTFWRLISLGNMSPKFYYGLYLLKIIEEWVYYLWKSFFPWDRFWLNLLWVTFKVEPVSFLSQFLCTGFASWSLCHVEMPHVQRFLISKSSIQIFFSSYYQYIFHKHFFNVLNSH